MIKPTVLNLYVMQADTKKFDPIREHLVSFRERALQHCKKIAPLTAALKKLGIIGVSYEPTHHGIRITGLESSTDFLRDYLSKMDRFKEEEFFESRIMSDSREIIDTINDSSFNGGENQIANLMKTHDFNSSLMIKTKCTGFIDAEYFSFSTPNNDPEWLLYQITHIKTLRNFILYFKSEIFDIIQHEITLFKKTPHLLLPKASPPLSSEEMLEFPIKKYYFGGDFEERFVTKKEMDCLRLYFHGLSAKQIGQKLTISHRTVEKHLENVRLKAKASNMLALRYTLLLCPTFLALVFDFNTDLTTF